MSWTLTVEMLATAVDVLAAANWQRSGGKGKRPRPIPRPKRAGDLSVIKGTPLPLDEIDRRLGYSPRG